MYGNPEPEVSINQTQPLLSAVFGVKRPRARGFFILTGGQESANLRPASSLTWTIWNQQHAPQQFGRQDQY